MRTFALSDLAEVNPRLERALVSAPDLPVSFLSMASVSEDGVIANVSERRAGDVLKGYTAFRRGDVLVAKITPCMENGKAALTAELPHEFGFGSTEFHVLRPGPDVDPRYLFYSVWNPRFRTDAATQMTGSAGQKRVPAHFFERFEVPLPPLPEQRRIAAILDEADALRRKRREALGLLDELLRSAFLEMFGDPVTNPRGWPVVTMDSVVSDGFRNGLSPSSSGTVTGRVLTLSAVTGARFDPSYCKDALFDRAPDSSQFAVDGTFLICRGNGNLDLVGQGKVAVGADPGTVFPDTVIACRPRPDLLHDSYLSAVWRSRVVRDQIVAGARTTNGTFKVNQQVLAAVRMPLPPLVAQWQFDRVASGIFNQVHVVGLATTESERLFDSLLHSAFTGAL